MTFSNLKGQKHYVCFYFSFLFISSIFISPYNSLCVYFFLLLLAVSPLRNSMTFGKRWCNRGTLGSDHSLWPNEVTCISQRSNQECL